MHYKAPVYQRLAKSAPGRFKVVYATDCSVRGHQDQGFGRQVKWDTPLLKSYEFEVCGKEHGVPLQGFFSLRGGGICKLIYRERPAAVILSQTLYWWDFSIILCCVLLRIPLGLRVETQDEAQRRSPLKTALRFLIWRGLYRAFSWGLCIGELNRRHLLRHGFAERQLVPTPYCVSADWAAVPEAAKAARRLKMRTTLGMGPDALCVAFVGKLIPKKQPDLLLAMVALLPQPLRSKVRLLFVGSGEMESTLKGRAERELPGTIFTGFINQSALPDYYWAMDILVLPSRRQGETWGLVVNEALHAGCGVVITDAVGCHEEFGHWERVRVIPEGEAPALAKAVSQLSANSRDFNWAQSAMVAYSVDAAAGGFAEVAARIPQRSTFSP